MNTSKAAGSATLEKMTTIEARSQFAQIAHDEREVLEIYRRAKTFGFADIIISVQEGTRVKLWLTEKRR